MRNIMKAATLESRFPVQTVENGCIISKDADITVVYAVELPELFTVASAEYEAIHSAWAKAIKVLPDYTVVLKQDWFEKENYRPDMQRSAGVFTNIALSCGYLQYSAPYKLFRRLFALS